MIEIIGFAAVLVVIVIVLKSVRGTTPRAAEKPEAVSSADSTRAREKLVGEARLQRSADRDEAQRPRAEKLWARAREHIGDISATARQKGIEVSELDLGMRFDHSAETLYVQIDMSRSDPEFLIWTQDSAGGSAGAPLQRVRRLRSAMEQVSAWVEGQGLDPSVEA